MNTAVDDRSIRGLRALKPAVDPWRAHGTQIDEERRPNAAGKVERALTVFLAGAECPFTCSFCDLWRWTIDGPTPRGALPEQIRSVLQSLNGTAQVDRLKLYNASNFFDKRAVPADDIPVIASLTAPFGAVTVESHASMVGPPALEFAARIDGRLEVAIGLETIHPIASERLNKRVDLATFDRAADFLGRHEIDLRVFVLLGAPHVPADESVAWTLRSVEHAARQGASLVSIIPVRGGNGELERLQSLGKFTPPTLSQLEAVLDRCLTFTRTVVCADLWDVDCLIDCTACGPARIERLRRINVTGRPEPAIECRVC